MDGRAMGDVLRAACGGLSRVARSTSHLLALLVVLLASSPAAAQQAAPEKEIAESQKRLQQVRREREQLRKQMEGIRTRVHDLSSEVQNLDRQVGASATALAELDFQVAQRGAQVQQNTRDLQLTREQIAARRAVLHERLRDIYKRGPLHTVQVLLTAESFADLINRYKYLFLVARRDRVLVREVAELEEQLVARERVLRRNLDQLEGLQQDKAAEHQQLASLQAQQKQTLSTFRSRERTTAQRIDKLAQDERRLSGLIATLERRRLERERAARAKAERERAAAAARARARGAPAPARPATPPRPAPGTLSTRDIGRLGWPVEGRLLYRYGRVSQPNGTVVRSNGIGIGAATGTAVRAVEAGSVVMAGPFEGYGPTVVLSHGEGYYSLYLYLQRVAVKEGDAVTRGQSVGTVGGAGTPEGPHIEFQIRSPGGQAVDPLAWLQKRGS